jgi:hypothetical protein
MSPKRGSLSGMLGAPAETPPPLPPRRANTQTPDLQAPEVRSPEVQSPVVRKPRGAARARPQQETSAASAAVQAPALPKYLRLERKELLIWPGQITELSILARALNRNRGGAGERITMNTLIRVAVALLLSRAQELKGITEEELRRALGLPE